jgi:hypothetical protein
MLFAHTILIFLLAVFTYSTGSSMNQPSFFSKNQDEAVTFKQPKRTTEIHLLDNHYKYVTVIW